MHTVEFFKFFDYIINNIFEEPLRQVIFFFNLRSPIMSPKDLIISLSKVKDRFTVASWGIIITLPVILTFLHDSMPDSLLVRITGCSICIVTCSTFCLTVLLSFMPTPSTDIDERSENIIPEYEEQNHSIPPQKNKRPIGGKNSLSGNKNNLKPAKKTANFKKKEMDHV